MSDDQHDDEQGNNEDNLKALRIKAKAADVATAENAKLKKELQFAKAGIDADSELGQLLFSSWEGDDVEELKAKAARLGALTAPAPTAEELARQTEDAQRAAAQEAAGGGRPITPSNAKFDGEHPMTVALTEFQKDLQAGKDPNLARQDAMARVLGAAAAGDPRVFFDSAAHEAAAEEMDAQLLRKA